MSRRRTINTAIRRITERGVLADPAGRAANLGGRAK